MPRCFEYLSKTFLLSLLLANVGCFQQNDFEFTDNDGDEFAVEFGDCDDNDANVNPDEDEDCNNIDDNCDGIVDEGFDNDEDNFTECDLPVADCDDNDDDIFPGAIEVDGDNIDNDCNGVIDDARFDNDADGFCESEISCADGSQIGDCDDAQDVVNPAAIEFEGDNVDNNCDGNIDEPFVPCDNGNLSNNDPFDFAAAIELCAGEVQDANFLGNVGGSRALVGSFGNDPFADALNVPIVGDRMIHLSTGAANTNAHDPGSAFDGTALGNCIASNHPDPQNVAPANGCGEADPATVCDLTGVDLQIKVPSNAQSFSFDFEFFSSEYRTFRCSQFDDTFVAFLNSQNFTGNISFDANNAVVSVNNGFFEICKDDNNNVNGGPPNDCTVDVDFSALSGTGYNVNSNQGGAAESDSAGATRKLTTTVGVTPNEVIRLRLQIFDEGDDILDSSVIIDNFRWDLQPAEEPVTLE